MELTESYESQKKLNVLSIKVQFLASTVSDTTIKLAECGRF